MQCLAEIGQMGFGEEDENVKIYRYRDNGQQTIRKISSGELKSNSPESC